MKLTNSLIVIGAAANVLESSQTFSHSVDENSVEVSNDITVHIPVDNDVVVNVPLRRLTHVSKHDEFHNCKSSCGHSDHDCNHSCYKSTYATSHDVKTDAYMDCKNTCPVHDHNCKVSCHKDVYGPHYHAKHHVHHIAPSTAHVAHAVAKPHVKKGVVVDETIPQYFCKKDGFVLEGEKCVRVDVAEPRQVCPAGFMMNDGMCGMEAKYLSFCDSGYHKRDGQCAKVISTETMSICPEGSFDVGTDVIKCVKQVPVPLTPTCPEGVWDGKGCFVTNMLEAESFCPEGFNYEGGLCIKEEVFDCTNQHVLEHEHGHIKHKKYPMGYNASGSAPAPTNPINYYDSDIQELSNVTTEMGSNTGVFLRKLSGVHSHDHKHGHTHDHKHDHYGHSHHKSRHEEFHNRRMIALDEKVACDKGCGHDHECYHECANAHIAAVDAINHEELAYNTHKHQAHAPSCHKDDKSCLEHHPDAVVHATTKSHTTIQKTCTRVTSTGIVYACEVGKLVGRQCMLCDSVGATMQCNAEGDSSNCFRTVAITPAKICPEDYTMQCTHTKCTCDALEGMPLSYRCPEGFTDVGDACIRMADMYLECPLGYKLSGDICTRQLVEPADCVFTVTYECDKSTGSC